MEKTDQQTHDFMNVESFSQLPFIRPSPTKEKGIRLFGKDFGGGNGGGTEDTATTTATEDPKDSGENSRKFECHYCCRNFPTSQALGGHQNAHKRERQHAKRAHLQSTMVNHSFTEAQMYGLMNYHRYTTTPPPYYHHTTSSFNHRLYGNNSPYTSHQTPINGSPLALWRYPNAPNSTFHRDNSINMSSMMASHEGTLQASRIATSSSYNVYESSVQDQVSLDLHL